MTPRTANPHPMAFRRFLALAAMCGLTVAGCVTRATEESAVHRGDQAFALGNYEEALAEYRGGLKSLLVDRRQTVHARQHEALDRRRNFLVTALLRVAQKLLEK